MLALLKSFWTGDIDEKMGRYIVWRDICQISFLVRGEIKRIERLCAPSSSYTVPNIMQVLMGDPAALLVDFQIFLKKALHNTLQHSV